MRAACALFVELVFAGSELERVDVGLGDAELDDLGQHEGRALALPQRWLERYASLRLTEMLPAKRST